MESSEENGACGGMQKTFCEENPEAVLFTSQDSFLNGIHTDFLEKVKPEQSGILDTLREAEVLSSEDEQNIIGGSTRREQARRLLKVLHRIPEEDFVDTFLPKFECKYPHVVGRRRLRLKGSSPVQCMRHAMIRRLNLKRLVDMLPPLQCCTQEEYDKLQAVDYCGEKEWAPVFCLLRSHASNAQLCRALEQLLQRKKIQHPETFQSVAMEGFVCSCLASLPVDSDAGAAPVSPNLATEHEEKLERGIAALNVQDEASTNPYPSSPPSSRKSLEYLEDFEDCADSGIMSIDLGDALVQPALVDDLFQTLEHKAKYSTTLNHINSAIATATMTRTDLRRMEMIRDSARSCARPAKDEPPSQDTVTRLRELLTSAERHHSNVEELCHDVFQAWEEVKNANDGDDLFEFVLPPGWNQLLMIRYHLLHNEVAECKHVLETAKKVLEDIKTICRPNPQ